MRRFLVRVEGKVYTDNGSISEHALPCLLVTSLQLVGRRCCRSGVQLLTPIWGGGDVSLGMANNRFVHHGPSEKHCNTQGTPPSSLTWLGCTLKELWTLKEISLNSTRQESHARSASKQLYSVTNNVGSGYSKRCSPVAVSLSFGGRSTAPTLQDSAVLSQLPVSRGHATSEQAMPLS